MIYGCFDIYNVNIRLMVVVNKFLSIFNYNANIVLKILLYFLLSVEVYWLSPKQHHRNWFIGGGNLSLRLIRRIRMILFK